MTDDFDARDIQRRAKWKARAGYLREIGQATLIEGEGEWGHVFWMYCHSLDDDAINAAYNILGREWKARKDARDRERTSNAG